MPVTLLGAAEIRALAAELDVTPTKKLGQNFVVDANTVRKIVQVARVQPGDSVVEVGPGLGSLTLAILETGASVDRRRDRPPARRAASARRRPSTASPMARSRSSMRTRCASRSCRGSRRCSSPTCPTTSRCRCCCTSSRHFPALQRGVVMVQAEVGERLAAPPGSKIYGSPSVEGRLVRPMAARGHRLAPGVLAGPQRRQRAGRASSATPQARGTEDERRRTFAIVDAAFQQRRKMLRQALSGLVSAAPAAAASAASADRRARGRADRSRRGAHGRGLRRIARVSEPPDRRAHSRADSLDA